MLSPSAQVSTAQSPRLPPENSPRRLEHNSISASSKGNSTSEKRKKERKDCGEHSECCGRSDPDVGRIDGDVETYSGEMQERECTFLSAKKNDPNPEKCLDKGQLVTRCVFSLLKDPHHNCTKEMDSYAGCMYYNTDEFELCRKEQKEFEKACPL